MNKGTFLLVLSACWGMLSACSQPQQINLAPHNQQEASSRYIIKGSPDQTHAVLSASAGFRVISEKHNIYEVTGLNYAQILEIAPNIIAEQNQYFESKDFKQTSNPYAVSAYDSETEEEQTPAEPTVPETNIAPSTQVPPAFTGCDPAMMAKPQPQLGLATEILSQSPSMNLGETVVFTDNGTQAVDQTKTEEMIFQWDVLAPGGSEIPQGLRTGKTLELKPDMVGMYQVIFVARDPSNACALIPARFVVTHNPEIEFAKEGDSMPSANLEAFKHLARTEVTAAHELATGKGVKVAVLDSGVHYNHLGIKFNLAFNEKELNGQDDLDDDDNEFKDDVLGWDFVNNDNKPFDDQGHGSHVSGLAVSHLHGAAKDARLIPVKVLSASGGGDVASVIAGVYYAVDNGADVINASLGGFRANVELFTEAVEHAQNNGVVFIAASGNESLNLSLPGNEVYPGELDVTNIINVAAVGADQNLASYSNLGKDEVDVAAPGGDQTRPVYSLATENPMGIEFVGLGGTSMAAPIVAGIAALMKEANPDITPEEIRDIMMNSGQEHEELSDVVGSGRIISAKQAVEQTLAMKNQKDCNQ